MKDSSGREPWWNADRCAPRDRGAAVAEATAECQLRLSAFCFRFLFLAFPFVPSVMPGLDPGIHTEATHANASTGICLLHLSMDHRIKSGGDES
jgi:hypothetical protein